MTGPALFGDEDHARNCHARWMARRNRTEDDTKDDELGSAQCGNCRFIIPIEGALASDWGVCSNPRPPFGRSNPGFVPGGKTAGGAREYIVPNLPITQLKNVTIRIVP